MIRWSATGKDGRMIVGLGVSDENVKHLTAGEPIFVADPESEDEDGGVVLSVVLDGVAGKSYLLVLDAKEFKEVGRANVDGVVGFGFHGTHVPEKVVKEGQTIATSKL